MLAYLAEGEFTTTEIAVKCDLSRSAAKQHLILAEEGLIGSRPGQIPGYNGRCLIHRLIPEAVAQPLQTFLREISVVPFC